MKFNILEKKALIGLLCTIIFFIGSILYIGNRNLWFVPKVHYKTKIKDADGLSVGALVTLSGLRVGDVTELKVNEDNHIDVTFSVRKSLSKRINSETIAKLHRNFMIGQKRIDLIPGNSDQILKTGSYVKGQDSTEIADILSGKNMGSVLSKLDNFEKAINNWSHSFLALSEKINPEEVVAIYSLIRPTLQSVKTFTDSMRPVYQLSNEIRLQFIKNKLAQRTLKNVEKTLSPLAKRQELLEDALDSVARLTSELAKYPNFAKDLVGTLKETSITLKAIQKTWLLRDHVEKIKENKER